MSRHGRFITVEGSEGAGKSTNLAIVRERLEAAGLEVVMTREPGGTPLAEDVRGLLLARREEGVDPLAELLLIFAARAQHLAALIRPSLERGAWVLCDRFTDATFAYQGGGRELGLEAVATLERLVHPTLQPDLTLLLDVPLAEGLERSRQRGELDRFEVEEVAFFERVRAVYLQRAREHPRFRIVDAGRALDAVAADVARITDAFLDECGVQRGEER